MVEVSLAGVRILHVHTLPVVSGSGINTLLTMQGSRDLGASVSLASAPGGRLEQLVGNGGMEFIPVHDFVSELSPRKDLYALWQLDRLLARRRFDIVHTHNSKAGFLGRLAAWRRRIPIVIHTIHGFAFHDAESWFLRRAFVLAERAAGRWCHQMIAISQPMLEWALRERIGSRQKIVKIFSGIPMDRFRNQPADSALRESLGIHPGEVVVGIVSKLWEGKGHHVLIEAVARLISRGHPLKLLVVGEGRLEHGLRRQTQRLGIQEAVVFAGFRSDIPEITSLLDVSVLPSFYEGMGRVVLEAMACAKPVVASRVGGLPELVEDGVTGYLVPPGEVGDLAGRLEDLVLNPELRRTMGERGLSRVKQEHSAAAMVRMIHGVYFRFLDRADARAGVLSSSAPDPGEGGLHGSGTDPGSLLRR